MALMVGLYILAHMTVFNLSQPENPEIPIIISVPHCGTEIPDEIRRHFQPGVLDEIDDTDWYVDKLYSFALEMGITMISANYSRWVVDLNRFPNDKPMYNDGRIITGIIPETDFIGNSLYNTPPDAKEITRRISLYYEPYHQKLAELLKKFKSKFGKVLLLDAHSIRQWVPTIHPKKLPDFILGDNNQKSASTSLIITALKVLKKSGRKVMHNNLFRGGYITRNYGHPDEQIHALQLEMTKSNYMDNSQCNYHLQRANKTRHILRELLDELIKCLSASESHSI